MALTDLERLKTYMGKEYSARDDSVLEQCVRWAVAFFERQVGRAVEAAEYTDTMDGNGSTSIVLRRSPVVSVDTVTINGETIPEKTSWDGEGWSLKDDQLRLSGYRFSTGLDNVTVVYTAGFPDGQVPASVEMAVTQLAALYYREKDRLGIFSTSDGTAGTKQFQVISLPISIKTAIEDCRQWSVV